MKRKSQQNSPNKTETNLEFFNDEVCISQRIDRQNFSSLKFSVRKQLNNDQRKQRAEVGRTETFLIKTFG